MKPRIAWLVAMLVIGAVLRAAEAPARERSAPSTNRLPAAAVRVALVDRTDTAAPLAEACSRLLGAPLIAIPTTPGAINRFATLRDAEVAIFVEGPGRELSADDVQAVRDFVESGAGVVVLAADSAAWAGLPIAEWIGATPAGPFAAGASLAVIDLYAHPILTGVARLESKQSIRRYDKLADDAQIIIEGTVGETTTPVAWVRQRGAGRLVHCALAVPALFTDPSYQLLIANAVRWSVRRPIPGAAIAVQRTFMPDAYPGAFAITLPEGPGVCLDPVRGGINYIWAGDFVDLRPRWLTKEGKPARFFGETFYRETAWQPLRAGGAQGGESWQFRGYAMGETGPEFHYDVGGRDVYESFAAAPGGGLIRKFRVGPGAQPLSVQLEPQPAAEITTQGLRRDGNNAYFTSKDAGVFTIEIRRRALVTP